MNRMPASAAKFDLKTVRSTYTARMLRFGFDFAPDFRRGPARRSNVAVGLSTCWSQLGPGDPARTSVTRRAPACLELGGERGDLRVREAERGAGLLGGLRRERLDPAEQQTLAIVGW